MKFHRRTHSTILKNTNFKRAWQLSHNMEISGTISSIAKACEDLKPYIVSDSTSRRKRLALDTSSTILVGLAKAFSKQTDTIFTDMFKILDKNVVDTSENSDKFIPRSSSNAEYHNKPMNMSLDISSIIDENQQEIIEYDPTSDESVSHENKDNESIENYIDQEYINDAKSNNNHISSKQSYNSQHAYGNIRKRGNPIVNATSDNKKTSDDDDSSGNQYEENYDDSSSRGESESCSENCTIPEDSENVTLLHETEGNQELDLNVTYELNMTKSPIIPTIIAPIEQKAIAREKSPIISWPTSQEFKNKTKNNNNNAMTVKPLTLHIPPTFFNAPNETLGSDLLQSPIILTKVATKLQESPSKRKYIDPDGSEITEKEKRAKRYTEESNNNENVDIDQAKSPIIPYKIQATDNENNKFKKLLYIENSTQTENSYIHLSDEEVNKSDKLDKPIELIPRSSSNAEYHNKPMNMSVDISSIIDENQQEIIEHYPTSDESVSHENKDDDDSSDNEDERNDDDISSRDESESCSENVNQSSLYEYLSTIPEDSENVTSLHETEGDQELDVNVTNELNMTKSPIIPTIIAPIEQKAIAHEKSPIISWPTSQEFKSNTENNNNNAVTVKPLTLQIPPTIFNASNETLASDLLQSPIIITKVATNLQKNPSKRKYIDPDGSTITENEKRAKEDTEESNNNENVAIDQAKSPIIPYKVQATDNQNNKIKKLLYKDNSTQTENNYIHLSDEEVNESDQLGMPVCTFLVYDSESDVTPRYLIHSKVNPQVMETLSRLANTSV